MVNISCKTIPTPTPTLLQGNIRAQRGTLRALVRIYMPLKLFLVYGNYTSVFRDVRTDYNLDLRFLVKKQISITADLS